VKERVNSTTGDASEFILGGGEVGAYISFKNKKNASRTKFESAQKRDAPGFHWGGSITCCKVNVRTTGKDISQLKRKLKYIMGYPRI